MQTHGTPNDGESNPYFLKTGRVDDDHYIRSVESSLRMVNSIPETDSQKAKTVTQGSGTYPSPEAFGDGYGDADQLAHAGYFYDDEMVELFNYTPDEVDSQSELAGQASVVRDGTTQQNPTIHVTDAPQAHINVPTLDLASHPRLESLQGSSSISSIAAAARPNHNIYTRDLPYASPYNAHNNGYPVPSRSIVSQAEFGTGQTIAQARPITSDNLIDPMLRSVPADSSRALRMAPPEQSTNSSHEALRAQLKHISRPQHSTTTSTNPALNAGYQAPSASTTYNTYNAYANGSSTHALPNAGHSTSNAPFTHNAFNAYAHGGLTNIPQITSTTSTGSSLNPGHAAPTYSYTFPYPNSNSATLVPAPNNLTTHLNSPSFLTLPLGRNVGQPLPPSLHPIINALRDMPYGKMNGHPMRHQLKKPFSGRFEDADPAARVIRQHFWGGLGTLREDSELRHWYGDTSVFTAKMWEFLVVKEVRGPIGGRG